MLEADQGAQAPGRLETDYHIERPYNIHGYPLQANRIYGGHAALRIFTLEREGVWRSSGRRQGPSIAPSMRCRIAADGDRPRVHGIDVVPIAIVGPNKVNITVPRGIGKNLITSNLAGVAFVGWRQRSADIDLLLELTSRPNAKSVGSQNETAF